MVILRNLLILIALFSAVRFFLPHLPSDPAGPMKAPSVLHAEAERDPLDPGAICFDRAEKLDPGYATARVSNKSLDSYVSDTRYRLDTSIECLLERNEQRLCEAGVKPQLIGEVTQYFKGARYAAQEAATRLERIKAEHGVTPAESPESVVRLQELAQGANPQVLMLLDHYAAAGRLRRSDFINFLGFPHPDPTLDSILSRPQPQAAVCG